MSFTKKLTSSLVATSLVLGMVSTAFAAPSAEEVNAGYARLNHYGIVQGKADGTGAVTPALEDPITRAELLTILVRSWGQEANAKLLKGATTGFADVDGVAGLEWATGYVFIGSRLAQENGGQALGTGAGTFNPNGQLTAVQTLAFTMKFLGLTVPGGANWAADTVKAAMDAGLITEADAAKFLADAEAAVNRGQAFAFLDTMFGSYNKLPGGKTIYTSFVDTVAPQLTVNKPEATTDKAAITVTGSVKGDYKAVYLGSEPVTVNEDGTFSIEAKLAVGANTVTVTAVDMVGNTAEASYTVTRNAGAAAKITASLAGSIVAGEAADLSIAVVDAEGTAVEVAAADITVTVGGNVGSYDATTGKFTAAEKVGTGTITVSYGTLAPATVDVKVEAGELAQLLVDKASVAKGDIVKLTAADKYGNAIASNVTYSWTGAGIAVTAAGVVYTSEAGKFEVTATSGELTAKATIGVYGKVAGLSVNAPESVVANGVTRTKVEIRAVDEFGNPNAAFDKWVKVTASGADLWTKASGGAKASVFKANDSGVVTLYVIADSAMAGEEILLSAVYAADAAAATVDNKVKGEAIINAAAAVATSLKAKAPTYLAANSGDTATVTVEVLDQAGEPVEANYEVSASITGPAKLEKDSAVYGFESPATFTINNNESVGIEGSINVTFNVEGVGSTSATVKHVIAGNPTKFALTSDKDSKSADGTFEFTLEVQDRNGVPVALYGGAQTIILTLPTAHFGKFTLTGASRQATDKDGEFKLNLPAGAKSVDFTLKPKAKFTGNLDITATLKDYTDATSGYKATLKGSKTVAVTAGAVNNVEFTSLTTINAPVASPKATMVVQAVDQFSNAVAEADVAFSVYADKNSDAKQITVNGKNVDRTAPITVKTGADGKATLELVAKPYAGNDYLVSIKHNDTKGWAGRTLMITGVVVAGIDVKAYKQVPGKTEFARVSTVEAGDVFWLVATVTDNFGGPVTADVLYGIDKAGTIALVAPGDTLAYVTADDDYDELDLIPTTGGIANMTYKHAGASGIPAELGLTEGQWAIQLRAGVAGLAAVGAKYTRLETAISKTTNINVKAGALAGVAIAEANDDDEVTIKNGKVAGPFTLNLVDAYGNNRSMTASQEVTIALGAGEDKADLTFRTSESGATVTKLSTRGTVTFYIVGSVADFDGETTKEIEVDFTVKLSDTVTSTYTLYVTVQK